MYINANTPPVMILLYLFDFSSSLFSTFFSFIIYIYFAFSSFDLKLYPIFLNDNKMKTENLQFRTDAILKQVSFTMKKMEKSKGSKFLWKITKVNESFVENSLKCIYNKLENLIHCAKIIAKTFSVFEINFLICFVFLVFDYSVLHWY